MYVVTCVEHWMNGMTGIGLDTENVKLTGVALLRIPVTFSIQKRKIKLKITDSVM